MHAEFWCPNDIVSSIDQLKISPIWLSAFSIRVQASSFQKELQESCSNYSKWRGTKQQASQAPSESEELSSLLPLSNVFDCLWHHKLHPGSCDSNGLCPIGKHNCSQSIIDGASHVKAHIMTWCSSCQRPAVLYRDLYSSGPQIMSEHEKHIQSLVLDFLMLPFILTLFPSHPGDKLKFYEDISVPQG